MKKPVLSQLRSTVSVSLGSTYLMCMVKLNVLRCVGYRETEAVFREGINIFLQNTTNYCVEDILPRERTVFV